ncbi:MAG: AI-2E family transporter [Pseudomonadota bacterium]
MDAATKTGVWIIAAGVIVAVLYFARAILSPFALAVFLFLVIEGFARAIDNAFIGIDRNWGRLVSIIIVLGGFIIYMALMASGVATFSGQASEYETKINRLIADGYSMFMLSDAPTLSDLLFGAAGGALLSGVASTTATLSENLILILIYIAFLFLAQHSWSGKLDAIFPDPDQRERARHVGHAARKGIETYLWTQTVISALITALTWGTLSLLGVQNAMFLAALIFVLNYIPTIGSIVAAFVPLAFALVQPSIPDWIPGEDPAATYIYAGIVFASVSFWQFSIGNFVQPRMMGDSLNLSALVVLLALAVWGALWGIPGMFLSAPLTVLMMILFAQSPSTRWVAVILSADGRPEGLLAENMNDSTPGHSP